MTNCDLNIINKRCEECIRPLCQRKLRSTYKWEEVSLPIINEYKMHELCLG